MPGRSKRRCRAMDGELGERLQQILSDPAQMEKLSAMAKDLFGQAGTAAPAEEPSAPAEKAGQPAAAMPDARLLSALGKAFSGAGEKSRSTALLVAMRPYMKPEKQQKLDRAMQIARMVHIAGAVAKEYGDGHGL